MATKKRQKKLTSKEKRALKELRTELREKGILPPVKPKLNRNKFAIETINEFRENFGTFGDAVYLYKAINCMTPDVDMNLKPRAQITPEQVGVLKVMKLAMEIKKFEKAIIAKGETKYSVGELYEKVIAPIVNL